MRYIGLLGGLLSFAMLLAACGDDDNSFKAKDDRPTSSSSTATSSSAEKESEYDEATHTLTDLRDGQTYRTVTIGDQVWMAENLNYDYDSWQHHSYCYRNDEEYCNKYGRLYQALAAIAACPNGWHLPDSLEFVALIEAVGGEDVAREKLKSTSDWPDGENGTDEFGFAALPTGYRDGPMGSGRDEAIYVHFGDGTAFWSSSVGKSYGRVYMSFVEGYALLTQANRDDAFCARCVKD